MREDGGSLVHRLRAGWRRDRAGRGSGGWGLWVPVDTARLRLRRETTGAVLAADTTRQRTHARTPVHGNPSGTSPQNGGPSHRCTPPDGCVTLHAGRSPGSRVRIRRPAFPVSQWPVPVRADGGRRTRRSQLRGQPRRWPHPVTQAQAAPSFPFHPFGGTDTCAAL
ncbi:hypothetical protein RC1_0666 [Rhodospirillum centenum SW]|uniref:Uncharacterized protein n=1 Tax=Rhodospirillum centenum (strain ATCC 51521 / SW) TaxID=414684 RepID=B6IRL5_RHOCS|nr:hypothetical protein RC1_0666 [Rhodospirillum centenum SW]